MKSVPSLLFFRPMKEEPPEWVQVFGWSIFTPDGHISGRGVDKGLPCEMAFKLPYRPGEKCLDKSTGRVVTILSCDPMRVDEVTEEDCMKLGFVPPNIPMALGADGWYETASLDHDCYKRPSELFLIDWLENHPSKEWAWRVEAKEEKDA